MKNFLWRMRSNAIWFLAALILFTGAYLGWAYYNIEYSYSGQCSVLVGVSPVVISLFVGFAFFFVYAKRYTCDEAYFYGESRIGAFGSATCGAVAYSIVLALYALGMSLIVRRNILSDPDLIVSSDLYHLSFLELFANFMHMTFCNIAMFEAANLFRKFKTWKFWVTAMVCIAAFICLGWFCVLVPLDSYESMQSFNFWGGMFSFLIPFVIILLSGDIFMTRGRQYR